MEQPISHDFLPNDQRIIELVEKMFAESDTIAHQLMRKIIEAEHERGI
jgi:hypothetical protein